VNWFKRLFKKNIEQKPNVGKLCECYGDVRFNNAKECSGFPLGGIYHTSFIVGECNTCGGLAGFPHSNLELAVNQCNLEGKQILENLGYVFAE
jgi:hypothetical protein